MLSNHFILCHPLLLLSSIFSSIKVFSWCFPGGSNGKESTCKAGDPGSIPGSGRSSGEGNGYPLQYSCLENSMDRGTWHAMVHGDRGAWWVTVHAVPKSQTWLSDYLSILKEISPEYSLEGLMLKLQYFGHLIKELTHWKRPWCWDRLKAGGEGDNRGWKASLTRT